MVYRDDFLKIRLRMVDEQLVANGIKDLVVLNAFREVPRDFFVPEYMRLNAYKNSSLPIGKGQTISQPYIVAKMLSLLEFTGKERVLEVGTGSGYQTALLSKCANVIYTIEVIEEFSKKAKKILENLAIFNVNFIIGDGSIGYIKKAPYDRIIVSAAAPKVPETLLSQLTIGGIMVLPVGDEKQQTIIKVSRDSDGYKFEKIEECLFVPLVGKEGVNKK